MRKLLLILTIILLPNCKSQATEQRELQALQEIHNSVDKIDRKMGDPHDANDLRGCPVLISLTTWGGVRADFPKSRGYVWRDDSWESSRGNAIDTLHYKIEDIANDNKKFHIVYVGPWKFVPKFNEKIRFIAFQQRGIREMDSIFYSESKTKIQLNEQPFNLKKGNREFELPTRDTLCEVKWIAKYGYNAVAEVKYPGFFNKIFKLNPVPTGKIIEAGE